MARRESTEIVFSPSFLCFIFYFFVLHLFVFIRSDLKFIRRRGKDDPIRARAIEASPRPVRYSLRIILYIIPICMYIYIYIYTYTHVVGPVLYASVGPRFEPMSSRWISTNFIIGLNNNKIKNYNVKQI